MKNLFRIFFIFLCFLFLQGIAPNATQISVDTQNYIQNDYQHIVLVAQNSTQNIVANTQSSDDSSIITSEHTGMLQNQNTFLLETSKPLKARGFIHNLSTNLKKEISIRAP